MITKKRLKELEDNYNIRKLQLKAYSETTDKEELSTFDYIKRIAVATDTSKGNFVEKILVSVMDWISVSSKENRGDAKDENYYYEIKTSYTNKTRTLNFLQIRPYQDVDYYIGIYVDLEDYKGSRVYKIPSKDIYELSKNNVMHGTKTTVDKNKHVEYRFSLNMKSDLKETFDKKYREIEIEEKLFN